MIGIVVSCIILLIGLRLQRVRGSWIAPDVLFCYEWALISFLASLHLFGMDEAKNKTWLIIFIGCISYVIGVLVAIPKRNRKNNVNIFSCKEFFFNKYTFWLLFLIIFYFSWKDFLTTLMYEEMGYTLQEMRGAYFGNDAVAGFEVKKSAIQKMFTTFLDAAKLLEVAVGIHYYTVGVKRNYLYIIAVVGLVVMEAFTNGGRWGLAYLLIEVLVCFFFFKDSVKRKSGSSSIISPILLTSIIVGFIIATSFARGWETDVFYIKYYRYLCGDIVFFDKHLDAITDDTPYFYIWNTFYGFWSVFFPFIRSVSGIPYPESFEMASKVIAATLQDPLPIGTDMITNAFITPFYHPYGDMGIFGVVLGMMLFGFFVGSMYRKVTARPNGRNVIIYLIACQMLLHTIYYYPFAGSNYVLVVLFFFFYRKKSLNIITMRINKRLK